MALGCRQHLRARPGIPPRSSLRRDLLCRSVSAIHTILIRPLLIIADSPYPLGVHTSHTFPIPPPALYDKNISLAFGRCPVRALYSQALGVLQRRQATFASAFVEQVVRFSGEGGEERVKSAYERFEKGDVGKVLFDAWN